MGKAKRKREGALDQRGGEAVAVQGVDTLGDRMQVRWDADASATSRG
jgi:hypothetical protein